MILYFVRHGESEANLLWEFSNGLGKHPLTEKGRQQALELAQKLKGLPITACYTSPILRALETAQIICAELGIPYVITDALREFDVGIFEGRTDQASWTEFTEMMAAWMAEKDWERRVEAGESFLDIQSRFVTFIDSLIQQYGDSQAHILLVGHGGTYHTMLPLILRNIDFEFSRQHHIPNTGVISAELTPDGLVCRQWGDT
jgi:broad specificity phosphatase PhoE